MSHRDLDSQKPGSLVGTLLDPQPGRCLDCCENDDGTVFNFFSGNEMEGHVCVFGPVSPPEPRLVPEFNWSLEVWTWQPRTKQTHAEWWANHPGNPKNKKTHPTQGEA